MNLQDKKGSNRYSTPASKSLEKDRANDSTKHVSRRSGILTQHEMASKKSKKAN